MKPTSPNARAEVESLFAQGMAARRDGEPAVARTYMTRAVTAARRGGDPAALARALHGQANVEHDGGFVREAVALYQEAVPLCRKAGDARLLAHVLRHLGDCLRKTGDLGRAEAAHEEVLALYSEPESVSSLEYANALRAMALLQEALESKVKARDFWRRARERYQEAGVRAGVSEAEAHLRKPGN